jgi:hypothetical protein
MASHFRSLGWGIGGFTCGYGDCWRYMRQVFATYRRGMYEMGLHLTFMLYTVEVFPSELQS